jgi:predicted  nucleic acid-binding Zn-ribbon protein
MEIVKFEDLVAQSKESFETNMADIDSKIKEMEQRREDFFRNMPEKERIYFEMATSAREAIFLYFSSKE